MAMATIMRRGGREAPAKDGTPLISSMIMFMIIIIVIMIMVMMAK